MTFGAALATGAKVGVGAFGFAAVVVGCVVVSAVALVVAGDVADACERKRVEKKYSTP